MKTDIKIPRIIISGFILTCLMLSINNAWSVEATTKQVNIKVEGMTCASCPATVNSLAYARSPLEGFASKPLSGRSAPCSPARTGH